MLHCAFRSPARASRRKPGTPKSCSDVAISSSARRILAGCSIVKFLAEPVLQQLPRSLIPAGPNHTIIVLRSTYNPNKEKPGSVPGQSGESAGGMPYLCKCMNFYKMLSISGCHPSALTLKETHRSPIGCSRSPAGRKESCGAGACSRHQNREAGQNPHPV
jgi:hypothetical protein